MADNRLPVRRVRARRNVVGGQQKCPQIRRLHDIPDIRDRRFDGFGV